MPPAVEACLLNHWTSKGCHYSKLPMHIEEILIVTSCSLLRKLETRQIWTIFLFLFFFSEGKSQTAVGGKRRQM